MADVELKDRESLRQSEESTAIYAVVSDETNNGEARKQTIAAAAEAQHRENPMVAVWERTTLFDGDATPETNSDTDGFSDTVHNLDYKSGSSGPRHDFTDGYQFFVFYFNSSASQDAGDKKWAPFSQVASILLINSSESTPIITGSIIDSLGGSASPRSNGVAFAKNNDTSFKIVSYNQSSTDNDPTIYSDSTLHLSKIEGLKLAYQPESI